MCRRKSWRSSALKVFPSKLRIAEHLPAAFLIDLRRDRRNHAVLAKQRPQRLHVDALLRQLDQVGHRVIAIGQVDRIAVVIHLIAGLRQLARVGVRHLDAVVVVEMAGERLLLVGPAAGVLGLDEAKMPGRPTQRLQVIEHLLHQELADVVADAELQLRVQRPQHRQHDIRDDALGGRHEVQPADAAEVRLDKFQRIFPHRADEIDHRVEPAEHRVVVAQLRRPAFREPGFLLRRDPQDFAHRRVLLIQVGQPLQGAMDGLRNEMDVRKLIGEHRHRTGEHRDRFELSVAQIHQVAAQRLVADAL